MKVVGIDLAGSEKRETGFCILDEKMKAETLTLFKDREIIEEVEKVKPKIISIDAPLALPKGRPSLSRKYKNYPHLRECDKELLKMGIKFFPITLGPMRKLTERGIKLKKVFEKKGFEVIETFPGAAQDLLKIPRSKKKKELRECLIKLGIKGIRKNISEHELDAITCALVGKFYVEGKYLAIGDKEEILMILPKI
ncbi:MAG: DUF429 domain-containing protein [Candidatus Aenigmatarchaeota archaeon]